MSAAGEGRGPPRAAGSPSGTGAWPVLRGGADSVRGQEEERRPVARDGGQRGHRPQGPRGEGRGGGRDGPPQEPRGVGRPRGAGRALGPRPPAVSPCASCTALAATPGRWHCRQAAPGGGQVRSVPHPGPKGPVGQHLPNTRTNSCNKPWRRLRPAPSTTPDLPRPPGTGRLLPRGSVARDIMRWQPWHRAGHADPPSRPCQA